MPRPMTADDLWRLARVGAPAPARDGSFAVVPIATYDLATDGKRERLFLVRPGADPRPLTADEPSASASSPVVSPDGREVAFLRKLAGSDAPQLHVLPLDGGEARRLGDFPLGVRDPRWLPDGRLVVVAPLFRDAMDLEATRRLREERARRPGPHVTEDRVFRFWDRWLTDGQVPHLFAIDPVSGAAVDLTPGADRWFDLMDDDGQYDVAPDGRELVFAANATLPPYDRIRWAIWAVPTDGSGKVRCLTPDNPADDLRPRYTPDGAAIIHGAKRHPHHYADRVRLVRLDRTTGVSTILTEAWDRSPSTWELADAGTVVVEAEEHGRVALFTLGIDRPDQAPRLLRKSGATHLGSVAGGYAWVTQDSMRHPPDAARIRLSDGELELLTNVNDELLGELDLGGMEELTFSGAGGDPVHMFLALPPGYDPAAKRAWPLLQNVHGGPFGMSGDAWHWRWSTPVFTGRGHVVALVNFHGSSSYGEAFSDSIYGDWGGKAAEDILLATDHLIARGIADPKRLALVGGSFGGYMTAWLASQTDRFACAIAHAAVYDLDHLLAGDMTQDLDHELGGAPWGGPEARAAIAKWDPSAFTHGYKTPMLIIHGEKDYRVPAGNALQLYGTLKARGVPARLVYYPDENHWILKPRNSLQWYAEFLGWLDRYLRPEAASGSLASS